MGTAPAAEIFLFSNVAAQPIFHVFHIVAIFLYFINQVFVVLQY
jgi:hypothetical protein